MTRAIFLPCDSKAPVVELVLSTDYFNTNLGFNVGGDPEARLWDGDALFWTSRESRQGAQLTNQRTRTYAYRHSKARQFHRHPFADDVFGDVVVTGALVHGHMTDAPRRLLRYFEGLTLLG